MIDESAILAAQEAAMAQTRYAVVIPAYNEAATIAGVAARAAAHGLEVIVVDDGSTDGTAEALAGLPVTVLRNERNIGKGGSLWRGKQHALALDVAGVITLDGDGQHAPEEIPRLLRLAYAYPDDIVIGARLVRRESAPRARYVANRIADFWIGWAAGQPFDDSQSGFRVYPASLLRRIAVKHGPARSFVFESEMLIVAAQHGVRVRSVAIESLYPTAVRRSHFRPVQDITRITCMVAWHLIRRGLYPAGLYRSLAGRVFKDARTANELI
jgi:glycosyltransferase involved in cell wall biosynthesis